MTDEKQRLLLAVAHPDDEAFGGGSMIARYASEGAEVTVVCATRGEAGEIAPGSDATRETLGEVREQELRASVRTLGVASLELLGYRDSGMAGSDDNKRPDAFMNTPEEEVAARLAGLMRSYRPQVVVTFDERGGYGHPDHILISKATVAAFTRAGDASFAAPGGGASWSPSKLYYMVFPRSRVIQFIEALGKIDPESDMLDIDPDMLGVADEQVTTVLDNTMYSGLQERAAALHRSQRNPFDMFPEEMRRSMLGTAYFVRVKPPPVDSESGPETDLFAGV